MEVIFAPNLKYSTPVYFNPSCGNAPEKQFEFVLGVKELGGREGPRSATRAGTYT